MVLPGFAVVCIMARQTGIYTITGTIDNLCFYKMEGKFYVRQKSSLSGTRVKKDPAFAKTMQYANMLGTASKIASAIYRQLDKRQKVQGLYRQLTGEAMQLLKAGKTKDNTAHMLQSKYLRSITKKKKRKSIKTKHSFADALLQKIFAESSPAFEKPTLIAECAPP